MRKWDSHRVGIFNQWLTGGILARLGWSTADGQQAGEWWLSTLLNPDWWDIQQHNHEISWGYWGSPTNIGIFSNKDVFFCTWCWGMLRVYCIYLLLYYSIGLLWELPYSNIMGITLMEATPFASPGKQWGLNGVDGFCIYFFSEIKSGLLKNHPFRDSFSSMIFRAISYIYKGFPIAMFDDLRM